MAKVIHENALDIRRALGDARGVEELLASPELVWASFVLDRKV